VDAKWGGGDAFRRHEGAWGGRKGAEREVTMVVVVEEEEARGSTRPRPRGAEEGSQRAVEGRSPGGRDEAEGDGQMETRRGGKVRRGLLESDSGHRAARRPKGLRGARRAGALH